MKILSDFHQHFLQEPINYEVEFIIIGGYSVIFHGYIRTTGDMAIWLRPANDNKNKLIPVIKKFNISEDSVNLLKKQDFADPVAFHFNTPPHRIEFLTHIPGLNYDEAIRQCEYLESEGYYIPFLGFHDLIMNKMMSGRLKDQADVEELQKIHRK